MPKALRSKSKSKVGSKAKSKFDVDLALRSLSSQDPVLGKLIKKVGKFNLQLEPIDSPFHALAESIVYQQLNGKAASTIFARVNALFDSPQFLCPHEVAEISDVLLRSAGLSRSKLASIKDLANKTIAGLVPETKALRKMSDEEIIEHLTTIRGIGQWTVEMMLIFRLGRMDVLPIHDYGIRKGFAVTFDYSELPKPKELEAYGERWRPYRTIASWYLWRALELK
jgi:DNA-3-methyladenine glycosylase II